MCPTFESQHDQLLHRALRRCGHFLYHQCNHDQQTAVLTLLADLGPLSQKDVQSHLGIKPGSVSELITKLEDKGCLQRSRDGQDRRKVVLTLTEKGIDIVRFHRTRPVETLFSGLSTEEKEAMIELLEKLQRSWGL